MNEKQITPANPIQTSYETIEVRPLSQAVGAEIHGVDLAKGVPAKQLSEIRQVFRDQGVIFFRDQKLTQEQHIAFAEQWGKINVNRFFKPTDTHPIIAEVRKEPYQKTNIGGSWHTDHSYDQIPAMGSILVAREVPDYGGDTLFASMYAAYESLSDGLQQTLDGLRAIHSSRHSFGTYAYATQEEADDVGTRLGNPQQATQDANHPVVIRHPLSGRKALYVNPDFTVRFDGWTVEESKPLLGYLYEHAARPEHTCRFQWRKNSVAMWDNRATWHCAVNDYQGQARLMHRITVEGVALE